MDVNRFGPNLVTVLKARSLYQKDLAAQMQVQESTVSLWVHGKQHPTGVQRKELCRILSIEEYQLFLPPRELKGELQSFGPIFND